MSRRGERFLGMELGGSRRTALVALDFFPPEKKAFLSLHQSPVEILSGETPDEALIRAVNQAEGEILAVDAPLSLPPCLVCDEPGCAGTRACAKPEVAWMRAEAERLKWPAGKLPTPYTQRPVDLLLRGRWQEDGNIPVEDSFGAGRAPLGARMQYLRRHLRVNKLVEANPRLTLVNAAPWFGISRREVRRSRDVEEGAEQRMSILESFSQPAPRLPHIFLYEADILALAQDLSAFDAFLAAFTALLHHLGLTESPPFPAEWGWVEKPAGKRP